MPFNESDAEFERLYQKTRREGMELELIRERHCERRREKRFLKHSQGKVNKQVEEEKPYEPIVVEVHVENGPEKKE